MGSKIQCISRLQSPTAFPQQCRSRTSCGADEDHAGRINIQERGTAQQPRTKLDWLCSCGQLHQPLPSPPSNYVTPRPRPKLSTLWSREGSRGAGLHPTRFKCRVICRVHLSSSATRGRYQKWVSSGPLLYGLPLWPAQRLSQAQI